MVFVCSWYFCCFVLVLFSCVFSYMHVSISFFCVGRGLASLSVLFSCIFFYIHVAFIVRVFMFFRNCMLAYRVSLFLVLLLFRSFPVLSSFVVLRYYLHRAGSFFGLGFFIWALFFKKLNFFLVRLSTKNHLPGKFMSLALVLCIFVHGLLLTLALAWAFFL